MKRTVVAVCAVALCMLPIVAPARAVDQTHSLADTGWHWPSLEQTRRVLFLQDYNTRVVVLGVVLLGCAAGMVGTFLLLRKRSLISDAIGHATLPGIALAFIVATTLGEDGKNLLWLLLGAATTGTLGALAVGAIRHGSRLKDDAALGIVLSVFFGLGIVLLGIATRMESGNAAGLSSFIYGRTASMVWSDALVIGGVATFALFSCLLLFKEFGLLCFDAGFAATQGYATGLLDVLLLALVVLVTVTGLQAVGLILVVALLVIPPAAARFWTHDLRALFWISAGLGSLSGLFGAVFSALLENLPAGAVIVLVAALGFAVSAVLGSARGVLPRILEHRRLAARVALQHLLRTMLEQTEVRSTIARPALPLCVLQSARSWTPWQLRRVLARALREGLIRQTPSGEYALTGAGAERAQRVVRNHRLWELYLITHADIAPGHVDRDADRIEHVLDDAMIRDLEALMAAERSVPLASPHEIPMQEQATGL